MEKERNGKVIAIIGLIVAVLALSVGFAAFTQSLNISTNAIVNPADTTLDIEFTATNPVTDPIVTTVTGVASEGATSSTANLVTSSGSYTTINNLSATFTDKGESVTYTFYVHNASSYLAYLRSVTFANATNSDTYKKCIAGADTTPETVNNEEGGAACDDISMTISIGGVTYSSSNASISNSSLAIDGYAPVIVTLSYDGTHELPDGDFTVAFGDITLGYSSVDAK